MLYYITSVPYYIVPELHLINTHTNTHSSLTLSLTHTNTCPRAPKAGKHAGQTTVTHSASLLIHTLTSSSIRPVSPPGVTNTEPTNSYTSTNLANLVIFCHQLSFNLKPCHTLCTYIRTYMSLTDHHGNKGSLRSVLHTSVCKIAS